MRVILVSHSSGLVGGSERSLLEIAKYLSRKSVDVTVILPNQGELARRLKAANVASKIMPYGWSVNSGDPEAASPIWDNLKKLGQIRSYLQTAQPDLVMTNTSVVPWFAYVCDLLDIPHVWFLREIVETNGQLAVYPNAGQVLEHIVSKNNRLLVNSKFMRDYYAKTLKRPASKIGVVYPHVDSTILDYPAAPAVKASHHQPLRLITYGAILPNKNQLEALEGLAVLKRQTDNFHMTIMGTVGSVKYYEELVEYVAKHDLGHHVTFRKHTNDPYKVVQQHDICIVPSRNEPFGRVTLEAMLLGKPVLANNSGGSREILQPINKNLLYTSGDPANLAKKIANFIKHPEQLVSVGEELRDYATRTFLGSENMENLYEFFLKTIAEDSGKKPPKYWISEELMALAAHTAEVETELHKLKEARLYHEHTIGELNQKIANQEHELNAILRSKRWQLLSRTAGLIPKFKRKT